MTENTPRFRHRLKTINMNTAQAKIKALVEDYIRIYPEEYKNFIAQMIEKKSLLINNFAEFGGNRALYEVPETLNTLFQMKLTKEEFAYFETKEGGRWFANNFKQFSVPKKL